MSLETLETKIDKLTKIIDGNGKLGLFAKVHIMWCERKSKNGLLDWAFRILIMTVISYIAVKVGIRA